MLPVLHRGNRSPASGCTNSGAASDRFACELRYHGERGVEAQILKDGDLLIGRRFDTRALAVQWAELERVALEKGDA